VSATDSAALLWSAASSSKKQVTRLLAIACYIPAIRWMAYTFCVSKAWFAANHAAIYGIMYSPWL
jgi:hypothetical protein